MTTLPTRAGRDVRTVAASPVALGIAALFVVGAVTVIAAFPKEQAADRAAATTPAEFPPLTPEQKRGASRSGSISSRRSTCRSRATGRRS